MVNYSKLLRIEHHKELLANDYEDIHFYIGKCLNN